jgi:CubicO group peptidase (beta-lactamase class C family)
MTAFTRAESVLDCARDARVFSAVAAEVGSRAGAVWQFASGRLSFGPAAAAVDIDTVFDLASLTKVLATTALAAGLVARDSLVLDVRVSDLLQSWVAPERLAVTVRDLLEHCSGLPGFRPYFRHLRGRAAFEDAIAREPLEYEPRHRSIYSDLGFILLGFILEDRTGAPLDAQFDRWRAAAGLRAPLGFLPDERLRPRIAATENDPWRGRVLQGEVHDENTFALGGVAGHAGLFGTASAVGDAARWWMRLLARQDDPGTGTTADAARTLVQRSSVPGSSRALGWDTMRPTSSCGHLLSREAIGHTGFTGTSLWIDPVQDLYVVLLTNRVHPTRANEGIQQVRRDFHDAVVQDLRASPCPSRFSTGH